MQALDIARDSGSGRIVRMVIEVAGDLAPHGELAISLYEGGVRQLVLAGGLEVAAPFLAAGLVDRVLAYLPHGKASRRPGKANPWPLLPPGFAITSARRVGEYVQIEGQPEKAH